jgi:hypothetical protein
MAEEGEQDLQPGLQDAAGYEQEAGAAGEQEAWPQQGDAQHGDGTEANGEQGAAEQQQVGILV